MNKEKDNFFLNIAESDEEEVKIDLDLIEKAKKITKNKKNRNYINNEKANSYILKNSRNSSSNYEINLKDKLV